MTTLTITGNLTADPEIKFIPSGKGVTTFTVVSSKSVKQADGSWENTDTTFWTIKCWNKLAENCVETLRKGMSVIVVGSVVQEEWNDKNTGEKKTKIAVTAWNVGVDLKRHTADVVQITRSGAGDKEIDPWSAPAWQNTPTPPISDIAPF